MRGLLFVLVLVGCSSGDGVGPNPTVRVGRYGYNFDGGGLRANGLMVIDYATADSIAGHFEVAAYEETLELGIWNEGAYVVYGTPLAGGTTLHRLTPTASGFDCEGSWRLSFSDIRPARCSADYAGP